MSRLATPLFMGRSPSKGVGRVSSRIVRDRTHGIGPAPFLVSVMVDSPSTAAFDWVAR